MADIKHLKAEASISRKKLRAAWKLMACLKKDPNVQLDIDPVTWEPVGDCPTKSPAGNAT